jgi:hypothetical protein
MVARHEVYSFLDGFSSYHHITITPKDMYKIALITVSGTFVWIVMPFGFKNVPSIMAKYSYGYKNEV